MTEKESSLEGYAFERELVHKIYGEKISARGTKAAVRKIPVIRVKRIYDAPAGDDGYRVLVDRLWPRGMSRERSRVDLWLKDVAPSDQLRRWFNHEPEKWAEFKRRYFAEIKGRTGTSLGPLLEKLRTERVTLLYGARDRRFNNATALKEYLENKPATDDGA